MQIHDQANELNPDSCQFRAGDIDRDGFITVLDVIEMMADMTS